MITFTQRMIRISFLFFTLLSWSLSFQLNAQTSNLPFGVRPEKGDLFEKLVLLIDKTEYDSAEKIIAQQLINTDEKLNTYELYFLNCYEAEIMYYNALYDQGIVSALKAKELAGQLKNDTLLGNALNLAGIQFLQTKQFTQAKSNLKEALLRLPDSSNKQFFTQTYQVLANLAELYLYEANADSAIYFSRQAVEQAEIAKDPRGESLAYWSLAESELLNNNPIGARSAINQANKVMNGIEQEDVSLFLAITNAKIYSALNMEDSTRFFLDYGLSLVKNDTETDQAKMTFLEFLTDFSIKNKDLESGYAALNMLNDYRNRIYIEQKELQLNLIDNFYRGKEELARANILQQAQAKQITLQTTLAYALVAGIIILIFALIAAYRNFKNTRYITALNHQNELRDKQKKMELKSLEDRMNALSIERNRIASDFHDDIGAGLSSIHIYSTLFLKQDDANQKTGLVAKINKASAGLLDRMSDIIWSINAETKTVRDLLLRIKSFANELLPALSIKVTYKISKELEDIHLSVLARKNLYLTFKEALNNIAKYSESENVILCFFRESESLFATITDDGMGFDTQIASNGNGLKTMAARIENLGGSFVFESEIQKGTKITILIPLVNIIEKVTGNLEN